MHVVTRGQWPIGDGSPGEDQIEIVRLRPRCLVSAARQCAAAMLRQGRGPGAEHAARLAAAERLCEALRTTRRAAYSSRQHVETLAAAMAAESRAQQRADQRIALAAVASDRRLKGSLVT
ncbi:MAG: hypothetical protein AAF416_01635 [Pseudomonadota bacterium]